MTLEIIIMKTKLLIHILCELANLLKLFSNHKCHHIKFIKTRSLSNKTASRVFALHKVDPGWNPGTTYCPQNHTKSDPFEHYQEEHQKLRNKIYKTIK